LSSISTNFLQWVLRGIAHPLWSCVMLLCGPLRYLVICNAPLRSFVVLCGPLRYLVIPHNSIVILNTIAQTIKFTMWFNCVDRGKIQNKTYYAINMKYPQYVKCSYIEILVTSPRFDCLRVGSRNVEVTNECSLRTKHCNSTG